MCRHRGAEGWEDLEEYGKAQAAWCAALLDVPHGIPGPDPLRRVFSRWAPEELPRGFLAWTQALSEASGGAMVSIDGTTLRHACAQATATAAIPMVRAWASANRLVLGPRNVDEPSNAITAMPQLRRLLALTEAVVTMEAMGCQKERTTTMTEQEADDVVALKDHHPTRSEAVTLLRHDAQDTGFAASEHAYHATVDGDHGRIATRRYGITSHMAGWGAKAAWAHLQRIGMGEARRERGDTVQREPRSFLTALPAHAGRFAHAGRQPWGVEHAWHGVLAVSLQEDACRIRKEQGAQTFAVLRHIAFNLLRRESHHKRGIKARRKRAGWDRDYLVQVFMG